MPFDYRSLTPAAIATSLDADLAEAEAQMTAIIEAGGIRTWENTMAPLERVSRIAHLQQGLGSFMAEASPDPELRRAGQEAREKLGTWQVQIPFRRDLYEAVKEYADGAAEGDLSAEDIRLLEFTMRDFHDAGQHLDTEALDELKDLNTRLVELSNRFSTNIAEFEDHLVVAADDLVELPSNYVEGLTAGEQPGTYQITMAYPDYVPFMDNSPRRDLREQLAFKFNNRAVEMNRPLLEEALVLRRRIAEVLGLASWAHHRMKDKMAENPETVRRFYDDLLPALTEKGREELAVIAGHLKNDTGEHQPMSYDRPYYHTQQLKTDYGVDPNKVAEYFPLGQVMTGMFELTADVFGLRYTQLEPEGVWHEDVTMYSIDDAEAGERLAYFYADLFPRPGKFGHAAAFPLVPAHIDDDGQRVVPYTTILANFTKPGPDSPSLLKHDEVVTLFHEFGHVLHMSLSKAKYIRFSGAQTEWDFVEAPSQIMEHWCWRADVLAGFARHYQTGEPLPDDLVTQLVAARRLNGGLFTLRQANFGTLDLAFHGPEVPTDLDAATREMNKVSLFPYQEGTFYPASFGHLLGGYDAGYYGYLWAEVFGDDMFSRFESEGATSREVGMAYRKAVLEPNGSKPAWGMLEDFLGRAPSNKAFLKKLGI